MIDERLGARSREPHASSTTTNGATLRALCDRIVPQPTRPRRRSPVAAHGRRQTATATRRRLSRRRACRRCARPGGPASRRSTPKPTPPRPPLSRARPAEQDALLTACRTATLTTRPGAEHAAATLLHETRCCTTSCSAYYSHPTRGARSASAARPARAATCACISTGAIRGKPRKRKPAAKTRRARENDRVG